MENSIVDQAFMVFECPKHGWEAGMFCDESKDPKNLREWKIMKFAVARDASEAEVILFLDSREHKQPDDPILFGGHMGKEHPEHIETVKATKKKGDK